MIRMLEDIYRILHAHRRIVAMVAYGGVAALAYLLAFLLRFEFRWVPDHYRVFFATLPVLLAIRLAFVKLLKLNTGRWRFVGTRDVLHLAIATTLGSITFFAVSRLPFWLRVVPRSVILIDWILCIYLTAGVWITYRTLFELIRHRRSGFNRRAKRVLIVGAGEAGSRLCRELSRFPTGYRPVGFVDDDPTKWGTRIHGLEVLGPTAELERIAREARVAEIIIAVPSAGPSELRRIVGQCEAAALPFKVLPGIEEVLSGRVRVDHLRELRIEDLLGREPIRLELPELAADLDGRSVLITGAAGSIGSELARQVALHRPRTLVLFDQAETSLFFLELDLRDRFPDLHIVPVVGDVVDDVAIERVFEAYRPDRVFHAAAYKHVPLMEANVREAVRNNVIGTWCVASAAGVHGAEKFVLVSTDKAVRPVSVMGATKRLAEMVVLDLQERYPSTAYAAVRFGNVLGSNGSVIPIFKRQLEAGKPLTVTHPEATRYFMTIPEAVQLILLASLLPDIRGHVAMLEMGEPIRILDLAKNLLRLSGMAARNGQNVVFTGLRPGERLHEELVAPDEQTIPTSIPKVRLIESRNGISQGIQSIAVLKSALQDGSDEQLLKVLCDLFPCLLSRTTDAAEASMATATAE